VAYNSIFNPALPKSESGEGLPMMLRDVHVSPFRRVGLGRILKGLGCQRRRALVAVCWPEGVRGGGPHVVRLGRLRRRGPVYQGVSGFRMVFRKDKSKVTQHSGGARGPRSAAARAPRRVTAARAPGLQDRRGLGAAQRPRLFDRVPRLLLLRLMLLRALHGARLRAPACGRLEGDHRQDPRGATPHRHHASARADPARASCSAPSSAGAWSGGRGEAGRLMRARGGGGRASSRGSRCATGGCACRASPTTGRRAPWTTRTACASAR